MNLLCEFDLRTFFLVVCASPFVLVNGGSSPSEYMNMDDLDELVLLLLAIV